LLAELVVDIGAAYLDVLGAPKPIRVKAMPSISKILLIGETSGLGGARTFWNQLVHALGERATVLAIEVPFIPKAGNPSDHSAPFFHRAGRKLMAGSWLRNLVPSMLILRRALKDNKDCDSTIISVGTPGLFLSPFVNHAPVYYFVHTYPHGRVHKYFGFVFGLLVRRNWTLVTVSEFAARELRRLWHLDRRKFSVEVIRTGLKKNPHVPGPGNSFSISGGKPVRVLCVAACEDYKDPHLWFEVAKTLHEEEPDLFEFTWVGGGFLLEQMRKVVRASKLENIVHFVGWDSDPARYYRSSHVYMQVSKIEALGLSLIEAAQHSLPAVVTGTGGMPEVVRHGVSGIVCPTRETHDIADALKTLGADSELLHQLSQGARNRAEQEFSHELWCDEIIELINL
jgi:glycosyltransferase involved in cell wall biosynthesis